MHKPFQSLTVPGARLYYEVRGDGPLVVLVGSPMDAAAFAPLAEHMATDHTVVTLDPRGIHRSRVDDPDADSTPEQRAEDLSRLITHVDAGSAAVFGSSGGAVTALALAQSHPEQVHTVIAHEPPLTELLEDRDDLRARTAAYCAAYLDGDVLGAWTAFFEAANIAVPAEAVAQMFGGQRDPQVVADERFWFAHELRRSAWWQPDLALLRSTAPRIVVGVGEDSTGEVCDRVVHALARALATTPTRFPGGHIGFVDDPRAFAARLNAVLHPATEHARL